MSGLLSGVSESLQATLKTVKAAAAAEAAAATAATTGGAGAAVGISSLVTDAEAAVQQAKARLDAATVQLAAATHKVGVMCGLVRHKSCLCKASCLTVLWSALHTHTHTHTNRAFPAVSGPRCCRSIPTVFISSIEPYCVSHAPCVVCCIGRPQGGRIKSSSRGRRRRL